MGSPVPTLRVGTGRKAWELFDLLALDNDVYFFNLVKRKERGYDMKRLTKIHSNSIFFVVVSVLLIFSGQNCTCAEYVFENFESGSGGFSEDESFSVSDGRYLFKGDGTDSSQIKVWAGGSDPGGWNPQPDNSNYFQDFLVSADTFRESGADNVDYGLAVCTHQNTGGTADYVRLRIAGAGYYKIDKRVGDAFENIADWTESPLINKGTGSKNRLSVMNTFLR